jgi:hypothetical protein
MDPHVRLVNRRRLAHAVSQGRSWVQNRDCGEARSDSAWTCSSRCADLVGLVVFLHDVCRHPASITDLVALALGPVTDRGRPIAPSATPARAATCPAAAKPASGADVLAKRIAKLGGVFL